MKKERPNPKRPQLWYQEARGNVTMLLHMGSRIRILYPDGRSEWGSLTSGESGTFDYWFAETPCWDADFEAKNIAQAFELMTRYDERLGHPDAEFLGNL